MSADIVPSSAEGKALQATIQKQLVSLGWSTEDDEVMAEYVLVMLGNRKTSEQISTELSDLIGTDFDPSFVSWLFTAKEQHYPSQPAPAVAAAPPSAPAAHHDRRGPQTRNIFGAAIGGVKRDSREMGGEGGREPPQQRARYDQRGGFEGVPNGPRAQNGQNGGRQQGGGRLLDRVQPAPAINQNFRGGPPMGGPMGGQANAMGMPQAAYDAITQTIHAVTQGAHPSALAAIPFPALAAHPSAQFLPPAILAQAQQHAMAQAQAYAAMQGVWGAPAAPGPQGFNPNAPAFNPAFANGGRPTPQQQKAPQPKPQKAVPLPTKPEQEQICKHATECSKPPCPYSHPSPVATKESGLVLSSEACEKQLDCQDKDCPKSHVSPAQRNMLSSSVRTSAEGATMYTSPAPARPAPSAAPANPEAIPGAHEKPCKFAGACTRKGCVFLHPWDAPRGGEGDAVPCRWGAGCTRADCHFSHPPNRPTPWSSHSTKTFNKSKTFNKPSPSPAPSSVGSWPKEEPSHVSERLKRFSVAAKEGEEAERIIPGGGESKGGDEGDDKAKVEIEVDDEHEEESKKAAGVQQQEATKA